MDDQSPIGEFHHFQMVNPSGDIPFSISVLVHMNDRVQKRFDTDEPITADDCIALHEALKNFDGNFQRAFNSAK